jgi:hypothetical protein
VSGDLKRQPMLKILANMHEIRVYCGARTRTCFRAASDYIQPVSLIILRLIVGLLMLIGRGGRRDDWNGSC